MALAYIIATALMIGACGESSDKNSDSMQGIPDDLRSELVGSCDFVDIIFYNSPASMNQSDPRSIERAMGFISMQAPTMHESCNPIGRISYMSNGEIIAEGDIYLTENCQYIVFMVDNQPAYANILSQEGVVFFEQVLSGIQEQFPSQ